MRKRLAFVLIFPVWFKRWCWNQLATKRETRVDLGSKAVGEKERGDITHRNKGQEFVVRAREIFACCALHFSWHFWFEYSALQRLMEIQTKTSRRPWSHYQSLTNMTVGLDKKSRNQLRSQLKSARVTQKRNVDQWHKLLKRAYEFERNERSCRTKFRARITRAAPVHTAKSRRKPGRSRPGQTRS